MHLGFRFMVLLFLALAPPAWASDGSEPWRPAFWVCFLGLLCFLFLWLNTRKQTSGVQPTATEPVDDDSQYFETLPLFTITLDRHLRYRSTNVEYLQLLNLPPEEVYGKTVEEVLGAEGYEQIREMLEKALSGERVTFEAKVPYKGIIFKAFITYVPQTNRSGEVDGIVALVQNLTKRAQLEKDLKRTHDELENEIKQRAGELEESNRKLRQEVDRRQEAGIALEQSEKRFRAIFQSSPIAILIITESWVIEQASKAVIKILGFDPAALIGRNLESLAHPEDRFENGDVLRDLIEGDYERDVRERRFLRKSGVEVWCNQKLALLDGGPGDRFLVMLEDISQRKEMELELNKRAEALASSNKELEQFAFVASHDLSEPLDKIVAFGKLLEEELSDALNEESREYLDYMCDASKRMQELIASLLDLSLVTTKGKPPRHVDLNDVMEDILSDYKLRIEDAGAEIKVDKLPCVLADKVQIRQLFQNLIGNALKFHIPDLPPEIIITGDVFHPKPGTGFDSSKPYCKIIVKDKGIGFEQRNAERIFNPLQRLHPRNAYSGTGIGLAICRKIVDRHGGAIAAKSSPGKGTTFAVMLPYSEGTH